MGVCGGNETRGRGKIARNASSLSDVVTLPPWTGRLTRHGRRRQWWSYAQQLTAKLLKGVHQSNCSCITFARQNQKNLTAYVSQQLAGRAHLSRFREEIDTISGDLPAVHTPRIRARVTVRQSTNQVKPGTIRDIEIYIKTVTNRNALGYGTHSLRSDLR